MKENKNSEWELIGHSYQIADIGYYDGHYEITNGKICILTKDDDDESLQPVVDALNDSGCKFYQDDFIDFENRMLKEEIKRLTFMINNGLGWEDMEPGGRGAANKEEKSDFEPVHCQMDYGNNTVLIQFRGKFDEDLAFDYAINCYPSFVGKKVFELIEPSFCMGYENLGSATLA